MASPTCPKCPSTSFETVVFTPHRSNFKLNSVQCASCGAVVGVLDYFNVGNLLTEQNEALRKIAAHLGVTVSLESNR
jgi:hypothetical protein